MAANNSTEFIVYMIGTDKLIATLHPESTKKSIENILGKLNKITLAGKSLRLYCVSIEQKLKALKCKTISLCNVEVSEPRSRAFVDSLRFTKLIIFGVPLDITAEELVLASSAVSAMRIVSRSGGVKAPTNSVVVAFDKCKEVPKYVKFGYLSFRTKLFIPRPLRCDTCQAFGHSSHYCRKTTQTCPTCAGSHSYDACPNKSAPKC